MELIQQIKQDGALKDMCRLFQTKLKPGLTTQELADLYFKGMDFCISKDFPALDFMRANFKGKGEPYGVYVDDSINVQNVKRAVLLGECDIEMTFNGFSVSRVYVRHNSHAHIVVFGYAFLSVDVFDNSSVSVVVAGSKAKVFINQYGNSRVDYTGSVSLTKKQNF